MRAERLLRILLLLEAYESLTAGELARRLEVSARTIQRDLDSLSLVGVPVQLRVRTPAVHRLSWAPNTTITEVAGRADGWSDVAMTYENASEAETFLLGMAGDAVVIVPDELRRRIRTAAGRLSRMHAD